MDPGAGTPVSDRDELSDGARTCVDHGTSPGGLLKQVSLGGGEQSLLLQLARKSRFAVVLFIIATVVTLENDFASLQGEFPLFATEKRFRFIILVSSRGRILLFSFFTHHHPPPPLSFLTMTSIVLVVVVVTLDNHELFSALLLF